MESLYENTGRLLRYLETRRQATSVAVLMREFEWSRPTLFRAIQNANQQGYRIECIRNRGYQLLSNENAESFHGFSPKELESLAVLWQMLENIQNEWVTQYAGHL